ncbi:MAG: hypothetical protein Q7S40_02915 [Opitutaceae bacterium]|nr:hypothetical protein [Opitutaceae bacterium]
METSEERAAPILGAPDDSGPPPFNEAAESAFLAEARDRGEVVKPAAATGTAGEEEEVSNGTPLPRMEELVNQIPEDVRDLLADLFRARFVTVKRIPKRALKS